MAQLIKERARKPLVEDGTFVAGISTNWGPSENPGWLKGQKVYSLSIFPTVGDRRGEYRVELSRTEVLHIIADWMVIVAKEEGK